ncbi:MAG: hypothetical protein KBD53_02720 [Candidatus Omnitrophica bacterium]|nr:hypothetical protein [Candidatus Omnitrophota bacterium]
MENNLSPIEIFYKMRNMALNLDPEDIGAHSKKELKEVYGVLMEIGHPDGAITLIILADGTVSLYYEVGGGIIGAGHEENVKQASLNFLIKVEHFLQEFKIATVGMLPTNGHVTFYVLTYKHGILTADVSESVLGERKHGLSEVFYAGHNVISELRKIEEFRRAK